MHDPQESVHDGFVVVGTLSLGRMDSSPVGIYPLNQTYLSQSVLEKHCHMGNPLVVYRSPYHPPEKLGIFQIGSHDKFLGQASGCPLSKWLDYNLHLD